MFKVKQLAVAAAITLVAGAAMASNFRAGDQIYVPAAGHASSQTATFISDLFISNLTDDNVDISVIYATGTNPQASNNTFLTFPKVLTLLPRERRELKDFMKNTLNLQSALGQLIFNACLAGQTCTADANNSNANFRNISVESRIFSIPLNGDPNTAPTNGQLFAGIPWYNYVSSTVSGPGLDKVFITGIRNTDQYRTNMGFVNASQFSITTITATLYSGTGTQLAQSSFTLQPLGWIQAQVGTPSLFPTFTKGATSTGAYVIVQQGGTTATTEGKDFGCADGCPAFLTYGSQLDNQTQDATTLEPQYLIPLNANSIQCIYQPEIANCLAKVGAAPHHAVKHQF